MAREHRPWRPFGDHSPFNTRIPDDASVDPASDAMVETLLAGTSATKGHLWINIERFSIPVYEVPRSGAHVETVRCDSRRYSGFESVALPVWPAARPDPASDAHMVILDRAGGKAWDFWGARWEGEELKTKAANAVDLAGDGLVPEGGCRLVGFALLAGLIRPEEIAAGCIDHALVFAHEYVADSHIWPAFRSGDGMHPPDAIPCGGLVQLDPALDLDKVDLSPAGRTIARALQQYGMYMCDYAGALVLYAENPMGRDRNPWPELGLDNLAASRIPVERMRVLQPFL